MIQESFTHVRNHFGEMIDAVQTEHQIIQITKHGQACAVLMPCDEYQTETGFSRRLDLWRQQNTFEIEEASPFDSIRSKEVGRDFSW